MVTGSDHWTEERRFRRRMVTRATTEADLAG
jgi:hypothetical protein